jgi:hypothetical protein
MFAFVNDGNVVGHLDHYVSGRRMACWCLYTFLIAAVSAMSPIVDCVSGRDINDELSIVFVRLSY